MTLPGLFSIEKFVLMVPRKESAGEGLTYSEVASFGEAEWNKLEISEIAKLLPGESYISRGWIVHREDI